MIAVTTSWLTPDQAAEVLHVKAKTLAQWRHLGKGPEFVKMNGSRVRYNIEALERFMAGAK